MSSSSSSSPTSPIGSIGALRAPSPTSKWQAKLQETCQARNMKLPEFNIVSDRRGGRTAWSATVTVGGVPISARYWYDGQFVNNAKEDAAEVAIAIMQQAPAQSPPPYIQFATTR